MEHFGDKQLALVKALSFVRFGGTPEEEKAAKIITDEIEAAGGSFELMPFTIPAYECSECTLAVTDPWQQEIEVVPCGRSGDLSGEFKLLYLERGEKSDYIGLNDLSDTIVMINALTYDAYSMLCEKKPAGFITISGKYYETAETADLVSRAVRDEYLELGKVPGFMIRAKDATELVGKGAKTIRVNLKQREYEAVSHDVLAVIPGTEMPEESVVLTAHYDSVLVGTGAWDNATGSINLLYLYKYFLKNPVRRTLRFVWCGSEEQGLYGSLAYVAQQEELLKQIKFCFNFDMNGTILGPNQIFITGSDELKTYVEQYCKEVGWSAECRCTVHSSDSAPFCDKGIPAIGLSRGTRTGEIHTRNDLPVILSADRLEEMGRFSAAFITRLADSVTLPVETGMPDKVKEDLDKYFLRDKKKKQEEA